jgi:NAD(P)-dependent dehydrogenase (short-subunit alcohol dehydrogenase family)
LTLGWQLGLSRKEFLVKNSYARLFSLNRKVAVVTGALGILGKHFCEGLAAFGADVGVIDLDQKACELFARKLVKKYRIRSVGVGCDVSDPASVKSMIKTIVRSLGGVDILHNNAASKSGDLKAFFESFEKYSLDEWRKIMSVNLDGMFLVAQAVGNEMARRKRGGSIIQTASIYGIMAPDPRIYEGSYYLGGAINTPAVYSASKAGVVGLTKYLATYWAPKGIRVNTLVPGGVRSGQNDNFIKRYSARIPMGRMAQPTEMIGALIYLASDASSYVTGQKIIVDGGLNAW